MLKPIAFATALIVAGPAVAGLTASAPEEIFRYLQNESFVVRIGEDSVGDPKVSVRYYGTSFDILFYGCIKNLECSSIQFFSGYQMDSGFSLQQANDWNKENRFARAYSTDDGAAVIDYDVYLDGEGMSEADFGEVLSVWTRILADFEGMIGW